MSQRSKEATLRDGEPDSRVEPAGNEAPQADSGRVSSRGRGREAPSTTPDVPESDASYASGAPTERDAEGSTPGVSAEGFHHGSSADSESTSPSEMTGAEEEAEIVRRDTVPAVSVSQIGDEGAAIMTDSAGPMSRTLAAADSLPDDAHDDQIVDPLIGVVVADRYRIVERLGRGGMGIVYRVEHTSIGKLLAMKLLAGELASKKEVVRRFKLEALTVSKLSSPHTVQVFDYGVWNNLTYLVMELVEGMELSRALKRFGPMPFSRLGRLLVQVCSSLEEAHDKGITHRDIKPENIMILADDRGVEMAKVLDFGLAKLRESTELNEVTLQGAVVGTPYFISPEQVHGDDVDGRADVYALGAVMFRALTGTYPFQAKNPMGMFSKHLSEPAPSALERAPELDIPEGVAEAILKCMEKEPEDRFQGIGELRAVLIEELNALPLSSEERLFIEESTADERPSKPSAEREKPKKKRPVPAAELGKSQIATRAELEAYERKLRRTRWGTRTLLVLAVLGGAGGLGAYAMKWRSSGVSGVESEPNDSGKQANPLRFGEPVRGRLGRRIETNVGDRDFYRFDLEGARTVRLGVTSLPNMPICALVYRVGYSQPLAEFCTGYAGFDLEVNHLRLSAGSHYVAVMQDLAHRLPGETRYVIENVSDTYALEVSLERPGARQEVEPNDRLEAAQIISGGGEVEGRLGWMEDEDAYCTSAQGPIRWEVKDDRRPEGTVLEVTPLVGGSPSPRARLHPEGVNPVDRPRLEADVNSPWKSPTFLGGEGQRCLVLKLTADPWSDRAAEPKPSDDRYVVRVSSE